MGTTFRNRSRQKYFLLEDIVPNGYTPKQVVDVLHQSREFGLQLEVAELIREHGSEGIDFIVPNTIFNKYQSDRSGNPMVVCEKGTYRISCSSLFKIGQIRQYREKDGEQIFVKIGMCRKIE